MHPRRRAADPPWDVFSGLVLDPFNTQYWDHGEARLDLRRSVFFEPAADGASFPPGW